MSLEKATEQVQRGGELRGLRGRGRVSPSARTALLCSFPTVCYLQFRLLPEVPVGILLKNAPGCATTRTPGVCDREWPER